MPKHRLGQRATSGRQRCFVRFGGQKPHESALRFGFEVLRDSDWECSEIFFGSALTFGLGVLCDLLWKRSAIWIGSLLWFGFEVLCDLDRKCS
eukprot:288912-Pleurochrysis_carterae.AAC.1